METKLADLQLKPWLLAELKQLGYEVARWSETCSTCPQK